MVENTGPRDGPLPRSPARPENDERLKPLTEEGSITVELALAELRRGTDVRMTGLEGRLALLYQRDDLHDRRADELSRQLQDLDDRLTAAEREQVTRGSLDTRFRHTVATLSLITAAAAVLATVVTAFLAR